MSLLQLSRKIIIFYCDETESEFKKPKLKRPTFSNIFKDHVKIVKIYMVKIGVAILNRRKIMGFLQIKGTYIRTAFTFNKIVAKLLNILKKNIFYQI